MSLSAPGAKPEATASQPAVRVGFIVGPTGSGKSALAIELAERLDAEIVNADSRLFYRGLEIGTAKPAPEERRRVAHHLVDIAAPDEPLDVARFATLARIAIADISRRGRRVLVVGGSGLYLRVLRRGIFHGPPASQEFRTCLRATAAERGAAYLHGQLREVDPVAAARIGHGDLSRILRALEVFHLSGIPISVHQERHGFSERPFPSLTIGLAVERKRLYEAINRRFDRMIAAGLLEEVGTLLAAGYRPDRPPLTTIGYRQLAAHLAGDVGLDEAIALAKRDSRRLAKRQMTWFRREQDILWLDLERALESALTTLGEFFARGTSPGSGLNRTEAG